MDGLQDKVIVFAGAGGIATATAGILGAGGAKIVVGDVVLAPAERTVQAAVDVGGEGVATTLDISDEQQVKALIDLAIERYGRIDGLFNVAANIDPDQVELDTNVVEIKLAAWQRTIDVNLTGYLLTARYAIPHLIAAGGGSIVNTSSEAVYAGMADKVAYAATALTRHISRKYGKEGVRANTVSPGLVLTPQTEANLPDEFRQTILAMTPAPRNGNPSDIGNTVAFLLSDAAEWITGQVYSINGGTTMRA
ncbi:oxidoreductase [Rathayibacter caricis DSM 15933]|uniref:Oxidoreductase n=1 Tax=Rathayibacter caricis DSM 15933 TaxID=1328867 RepID=A0A2T4UNT4_9MICO|nr:SDR family NAD(P)-dependent oxidoreductase [Rathayibacter caricis]PTL71174.1 oxidoreductase [Rathayibacter caricis DSM 15933]